jgi:hypothetical protein
MHEDYAAIGRAIDARTLNEISQSYAFARTADRREILGGCVEGISAMAAGDASIDLLRLKNLGQYFPKFVLLGTLQQQFTCKLATHLLSSRGRDIPPVVVDEFIAPLSKALISVLHLGAPTTRDAAVEGLGGLLRLLGMPATRFVLPPRLPVISDESEDPKRSAKRAEISADYFDRLQRRHLMVLAIAEDPGATKEFEEKLSEPITKKIERLCTSVPVPWDAIEDALYAYPDLLRILPAIERQQSRIAIDSTALLCDAARLLQIDVAASDDAITIAHARFQESIFRTIDTTIRRWDGHWEEIDDVVAAAVRAIPRSIAGSPAVCNAQIRATVAIIRTAINLITTTSTAAATKAALKPMFDTLEQRTPWPNLGILEACHRGLFELAAQSRHDDLTDRALDVLLQQLSLPPDFDDLTAVHRHITATTTLRRVLASAMDAGDAQKGGVEPAVRALLSKPTRESIQRLCRGSIAHEQVTLRSPVEIAPEIIATAAFESELLARTASMFATWDTEPTLRRVLLTRILAAELHTLARDSPALVRHPLLRRIFTGIETVTLSDEEAMKAAWTLLASLPPDAAKTADAEVQRFVEYRGNRSDESVHDLPGYVLAKISTNTSGQIAGAIARTIDLHQRYERENRRLPDLAKLLYQVTLRGPHESIFDHLLPRLSDDGDRKTVLLFRRHVARVRAHRKDDHDTDFDLHDILEHVRALECDLDKYLEEQSSTTLYDMRNVVRQFNLLTQDNKSVWDHLTGETMFTLMKGLDALAEDEAPRRRPLVPAFERSITDLHDQVLHYLSIPIGSFEERKRTLTAAIDLTAALEEQLRRHEGLRPPERTLLVALMRYVRQLFDRTGQWACDEARKQKERNDRQLFWLFFCDPRSKDNRLDTLSEIVQTDLSLHTRAKLERLSHQINTEPPPFEKQRALFERYFVDWMTSELDVESLKRVLRSRWPIFFRVLYTVTTSFPMMVATILMPFVLAAGFDIYHMHEWEGIGFFAITLGMIVAGVLSFTQIIHRLAKHAGALTGLFLFLALILLVRFVAWGPTGLRILGAVTVGAIIVFAVEMVRWLRKRLKDKSPEPGYWFDCLLPRLARLTAVPMALIVEFDHSYDFPLHASTWALLLLAVVSFLTTRFFITREMVDREEQPGVVEIKPEERRHVRQIVAVALAHSFGIAIMLSAIFSSSHKVKMEEEKEPSVRTVAGMPAKFWDIPEAILTRFDEVSHDHEEPRFLGLIPRETHFDIGAIAEKNHYPLPPKVAEHASFKFYPTIILAWTALGLFFGIFLEGFMKGERLRGRGVHETPSNAGS